MTPEEMLNALNDEGDNAGADYNDGLNGWFGWDVVETRNAVSGAHICHTLNITFTAEDGKTTVTRSWTLQSADQ